MIDDNPECVCRERLEQHTAAGSIRNPVLICPDGIHEFERLQRCASCGGPLEGELAETARGIIHQPCMLEGEQIA